jgi:hypothetical protein
MSVHLDLSTYNQILGLRKKGEEDFIMFIISGQPYDWPEGISLDEAEFVPIGVPPQNDSVSHEQIPLRECTKCGKGLMVREEVCCSERAAGFNYKWICPECNRVVYSKNG